MVGLKDALARSQARATSRDGESILRRADELAAFVVNGAGHVRRRPLHITLLPIGQRVGVEFDRSRDEHPLLLRLHVGDGERERQRLDG
jgi:hypothetical protein